MSGAGDYDPSLMMDRDMILVIPQYRLGFLGGCTSSNRMTGIFGWVYILKTIEYRFPNLKILE